MSLAALYQEIHRNVMAGSALAAATVIHVKGSTPREAGAKMVIYPDGNFTGTIGGGCGEAEVWRKARWAIHQGEPFRVRVDLTEDPESDSPKICGGIMDVFVDPWRPADVSLAAAILDRICREEPMVLATVVGGEKPLIGRKLLFTAGGSAGTLGDATLDAAARELASTLKPEERSALRTVPLNPSGSVDLFYEVIAPPPTLLIVGAGHIAQPLALLGKLLEFKVVVLDDRPDYATRERFPGADLVRVLDPARGLQVPLTPTTHAVLVTRGHRYDEEALRELLPTPVAYIGMIGSHRRLTAVFADLEREGIPPAELDRVHAPVGLDIGAQTPAEIAVAIMGEIVKIRRGGSAESLNMRQKKRR